MKRRTETCGFKGGFIPTELESTDPNKQNNKTDTQWQGSSDREESLSDPRWHNKRPPKKGKKTNNNSPKQSNTESTTKVQDAREIIPKKKIEERCQKSKFPKIMFTDNQAEQNNQTEETNTIEQLKTCQTETTITLNSTISCQTETKVTYNSTICYQTETKVTSNSTQTKPFGEQNSEAEIRVSRVDPTTTQEELEYNEVPPTMTTSTSLEASHEMITEGLIATVEKVTDTTESEEDTPLFRKKLQQVLGVQFIAAATKKIVTFDQSLTLLKRGIGWQ